MSELLAVETLREWAAECGLDAVGVAPVGPTPTWAAYRDWAAAGYAAELSYLTRPDAMARRADPRMLLPEARSVLVAAVRYSDGAPLPPLPPLYGRVARYVGDGQDYHTWLLARLKALVERLQAVAGPFAYRCSVDSGAILERAWAQAAGLGWIGKHGGLIHPRLGGSVFLGVALLALDLPATPPDAALPTCGACERCLAACPTGALFAPRRLDARRCLSYLTIEHRGALPPDLRPALGESVFGCDACQEACPWNHPRPDLPATVAPAPLYLPDLLSLSATAFRARFRARFRATPLWRATAAGLARNAAIVLGNRGDPAARPWLEQAAAHPDPIVREAVHWALANLANPKTVQLN